MNEVWKEYMRICKEAHNQKRQKPKPVYLHELFEWIDNQENNNKRI